MQQEDENEQYNHIEATLYDRYASSIFLYIYRQVSSLQDAEDLLLEVFIAALKADYLSGLSAA